MINNTSSSPQRIYFTELLDLVNQNVGGKVLACSDDFFAEKENLIKPQPAIFIADKFTDKGKWMDGWESRRRRTPGFDWCVVKLGVFGSIHGVNIDTSFFTGNFPEFASIEACCMFDKDPNEKTQWTEILPKMRLSGGTQNMFPILNRDTFTHLRMKIYPDGGVARLRVHGEPKPNWNILQNQTLDLACVINGGQVVVCNDAYFGPKDNLIMPGRATNMGEGWETKRKRTPGYDWTVVKLGTTGMLEKIEIDTNFFKGNFPESFSLEALHSKTELHADDFILRDSELGFTEIISKTKLAAHTQATFEKELKSKGPFNYLRLNIYPDGGISRLKVFAKPVL